MLIPLLHCMWLFLGLFAGCAAAFWWDPMYVVGRVLSVQDWMSTVLFTSSNNQPTWVGSRSGLSSSTNDVTVAASWDFSYRVWETPGGPVYTPPDSLAIPASAPLPVLSLLVTGPGGRHVDVQRDLCAYAYEGNVLFQPGFAVWFLRNEFPSARLEDLSATCVSSSTFTEQPFDLNAPVRLEST